MHFTTLITITTYEIEKKETILVVQQNNHLFLYRNW